MAAPVGHIICALALLHSGVTTKVDANAFLVGTSFPDIRYPTHLPRKMTHLLKKDSLDYVLEADSSFEKGHAFHIWVDHRREEYMRKNDAYRFVKDEPWPSHLLKLVEDRILFQSLKGRFDAEQVFKNFYPEERAYGLSQKSIESWHKVLAAYLDQKHSFTIFRYYAALNEFRKGFGLPQGFFSDIWKSVRTIGFIFYAYYKIERLSRDEELRRIILDFYGNRIQELIKKGKPRNTRVQSREVGLAFDAG